MNALAEDVDGIPNISGNEAEIDAAIAAGRQHPIFPLGVDLGDIESAFAVGLHMHQPLIPAGEGGAVIGNLQWMMEHQDIGDNHNAPAFHWCYRRMGEIIPQLLGEGCQPRVMLDYSGTLLHGLRQMGLHDVFDSLRRITTDSEARGAVEWLGSTWGHAVAPSTPTQDFDLHVRAWQHHFAAIFGLEALGRVRGFSPAEMALPNHPDIAHAFVRTLNQRGFQWVLVQEHTVEQPDGRALERPHLPHRLVCRNTRGETETIVAIVKTQGSDSKLVAQMQPYYEAKGLAREEVGGRHVPPLVTQIADGENGGVMMNEFPPKYAEVVRECSGTRTPMVNVTEYLERLLELGVTIEDLPAVQPLSQKRVWDRYSPEDGANRFRQVLDELKQEDSRFHMEGGSWTNDISWVRGYEEVLVPMERASSLFHERMLARQVPTDDSNYRRALFHLLGAETSCYRYWGQGQWTDFGAEMARRAVEATGS